MLSFKPVFLLSSFTFIKRLFSSSSFSAIREVSSAYLRLLIFLPAILIPAYDSSTPEFCMMYSAYKVNKQGDNIQSCCMPFSILNQSVVPCPVLTVSCWPVYRFLKRHVRGSGIPISFRIFIMKPRLMQRGSPGLRKEFSFPETQMMTMSITHIIFKFYANPNSQMECYIDFLEIKIMQCHNICLLWKIFSWKQNWRI